MNSCSCCCCCHSFTSLQNRFSDSESELRVKMILKRQDKCWVAEFTVMPASTRQSDYNCCVCGCFNCSSSCRRRSHHLPHCCKLWAHTSSISRLSAHLLCGFTDFEVWRSLLLSVPQSAAAAAVVVVLLLLLDFICLKSELYTYYQIIRLQVLNRLAPTDSSFLPQWRFN